jgi:hypothetical protein
LPTPTAVGAASRYLDEADALLVTPTPILSGTTYPSDATAIAYRGDVLVLYSASSVRRAIAVAQP